MSYRILINFVVDEGQHNPTFGPNYDSKNFFLSIFKNRPEIKLKFTRKNRF